MRSTPPPPGLKSECETHNRVLYLRARSLKFKQSRHKPIMILPQVHLRKPCYDFYFLQAIEFERLLGQQSDACTSDRDQSEVLTEPLNR